LYFVSVGEGLLAQVAVGGGGFDSPGHFFIVAGIKVGLFYSPGKGVNSWGRGSWFSFQPAVIAIL
jgi:hypothetical protein